MYSFCNQQKNVQKSISQSKTPEKMNNNKYESVLSRKQFNPLEYKTVPVIQCAGHGGVKIIRANNNRYVLKSTNRIEGEAYEEFNMQMPNSLAQYYGKITNIYQVTNLISAIPINDQNTVRTKVLEFITEKFEGGFIPNDACVIVTGNVEDGGNLVGANVQVGQGNRSRPELMTFDIKIGSSTANAQELINQQGMSQEDANRKEGRMRWVDQHTTSGVHGWRYIPSSGNRFLAGRDSIERVQNKLVRFIPNAAQRQVVRNEIVNQINQIINENNNDVVTFIAASIYISVKPNGGQFQVNAKLIDLAHPVRHNNFQNIFQTYKGYFINGLTDLRNQIQHMR